MSSARGPDNKSQNSLIRQRSPDPKQSQGNAGSRSPMLKRGATRGADSGAIQDLAARLIQFEEAFISLEQRVDAVKKIGEEKTTREDVLRLVSDRVTKEEILQLIPNEEILQEKMKIVVRDEFEAYSAEFKKDLKAIDENLVKYKAQVNVHTIHRDIEKKANKEEVSSNLNNHEFKISTLDRNIIRMAADFETLQLALNKMHQAIVELQDANRDVLLGKRTTNCLSCGKGGDNGNQ
jgi:hypothetical protein